MIVVDNYGNPPFPALGDWPKASKGTEGMFKLHLTHDPTHCQRDVVPHSKIQLTLSGHTHAMQFMLGTFSPAGWFHKEWKGMYLEGNQSLYINTGLRLVMRPY